MTSLSNKISSVVRKYIAMLLEPIIGYSRVVSVTKISLLVVALLLTAILIILPFYNSMHKNFRITFSSVTKDAEGNLSTMLNPHLQGVDANGHTYNLTAKTAIQDKMEKISLKSLNADINLKDNGWISVSADEGMFDHAKNTMDLKGNINIFNHEGYEISTSEAHVDMKNNSMYGNAAIEGQGPIGTIRADNFSVDDRGNRMLLTGNVKVVIFTDAAKKQAK